MHDPFGARATIDSPAGPASFFRLTRLEDLGLTKLSALPYSIRVLLEAVLRNCDGWQVTQQDVERLAAWRPQGLAAADIPFKPARVLLQDFTGVPAIVDLAAMRSAIARLGGDPRRVNPLVPVDVVIDHSIQVDYFGSADALEKNLALEFHRNKERYALLRWAQAALSNMRVIPPGVGIIHQVNLEYLAQVVILRRCQQQLQAFPDTLVGTDSHTTMINGLGVLGWGVGGIEAEANMLGQPLYMLVPEVVGVELTGRLPPGATATDLVLTITQMLRKQGVVGKFVEYFGPAASEMPVADRAVLANMAPEYGATVGYFPVDEQTLAYLKQTGRSAEHVQFVERYCKEQLLFRTADASPPQYSVVLQLDLGTVVTSVAGPKRPQDRLPLEKVKQSFRQALEAPAAQRGFGLAPEQLHRTAQVACRDSSFEITHGAVVIASITSCTNTSNPQLMIAAGLLARKAVERGLRVPGYVKTSLAPGSRVVSDYLRAAGLDRYLEELGFHTVGYGCMTCIGNSGPLPPAVAEAITGQSLVVAAVLSGNRNFEGRIHPLVKANYLASPPLVVAYALAGTVDRDLTSEPLGIDRQGNPVYLKDIWPTAEQVASTVQQALHAELFARRYADVSQGTGLWQAIPVPEGELFPWDPQSTYIQEPPFLMDISPQSLPIRPILGARVLLALGDSVTTDHISPAGAISASSPAGKYLLSLGVPQQEFNSYGARRGNDRVMIRGTFANVRLRNYLVPEAEGGLTRHLPDGEVMPVYDAAMKYKAEGVPLVVLAGAEYGSGSSRDWAAKGTYLLGVRAVIASSFERIHRSNLVGMGVLPLEFSPGQSWQSLQLTGEELFDIPNLNDSLRPRDKLIVRATAPSGNTVQFQATARIDTAVELEYYRHGGILSAVLRKLANFEKEFEKEQGPEPPK